MQRQQVIDAALKDGLTRTQISKKLGIPYYTVQRYLKGIDGVKREPPQGGAPYGAKSPIIEFEGQKIPRTEAVEILADRGYTIKEIREELHCTYAQVYPVLARRNKLPARRVRRSVPNLHRIRKLYAEGKSEKELIELGFTHEEIYNAVKRKLG